jgi:hypothetical protein
MTIQKIISGNPYNQAGITNSANMFGSGSRNNLNFATPVCEPFAYDFAEDAPRFSTISVASGTPVIVSGITGKKIRVTDYAIISGVGQNAKWQSNTTDISGNFPININGGVSAASENGLFETAVGQSLRLLVDGSGGAFGHLTYQIK